MPKLLEMPSRPADPVAKIVEALKYLELQPFADHLAAARSMWRNHRALVEADAFPAHLRRVYMEQWEGEEPDDYRVDYGSPSITREKEMEIFEEARLRAAAKNHRQPTA